MDDYHCSETKTAVFLSNLDLNGQFLKCSASCFSGMEKPLYGLWPMRHDIASVGTGVDKFSPL